MQISSLDKFSLGWINDSTSFAAWVTVSPHFFLSKGHANCFRPVLEAGAWNEQNSFQPQERPVQHWPDFLVKFEQKLLPLAMQSFKHLPASSVSKRNYDNCLLSDDNI